jgi:hypothetical protein
METLNEVRTALGKTAFIDCDELGCDNTSESGPLIRMNNDGAPSIMFCASCRDIAKSYDR